MDFGQALNKIKEGKRVARSGWNGKGMWLMIIDNATYPYYEFRYEIAPFIVMVTVDRKFVPWTPSQTDVMAEDWEEVYD